MGQKPRQVNVSLWRGYPPPVVRRLRNNPSMSTSNTPSRHDWRPFALPLFFGPEPDVVNPWPGLNDLVAEFRTLVAEIGEDTIRAAEGLAEASEVPMPTFDSNRESETDRHSPMKVVLMGRTMAGKSSLLSALSGAHRDRIGDGRQRFSRDVFSASITASENLEIVDTPGVGAHGGADDTEIALEAGLDADVILWVNSSDSIQGESAAALRLLGVIGKPIIVVLNCRQALTGVGKLNLLRFPERVFGGKEGLVDEIRRHMADAGVTPLEVVSVHALAAIEARSNDGVDSALHEASRIDELVDVLSRERDAHREVRHALRLVDMPRQEAEVLAHFLRSKSSVLRARADRDRAMTQDLHDRLERVVRTGGEAIEADVEAAVSQLRDWHLGVTDFGKSLEFEWNDAVTKLQDELRLVIDRRLADMSTKMESTIEATDEEWSAVPLDKFTFDDLSDFESVWANRLLRAGIGGGGALAMIAVGSLVAGPVGFVLGAAGTLVIGSLLDPIKRSVDRLFIGKDGVLRKRRAEVAKKVGPILDEVGRAHRKAISERMDSLRGSLADERSRSDQHAATLDQVAASWSEAEGRLRARLSELDRGTTAALLRINGRERLARSLQRVTRVPGVCTTAEMDEAAFWEAWLFPPDVGEALAAGKRSSPAGKAPSALSYVLGLVDAPVVLARADLSSASVQVELDLPAAILGVWSAALSTHLERHVQIESRRT